MRITRWFLVVLLLLVVGAQVHACPMCGTAAALGETEGSENVPTAFY